MITSLDGIEYLTGLEWVFIQSSQITTLDLSNNTALTSLAIYNSPLATLNISNNTSLTWLSVRSDQLTALDVSNNVALTWLSVGDARLTTLDLINNTALEGLSVFRTPLTILDISNNTALTRLWANNNQLTSLDVRNNPVLERLEVINNFMISPDDVIGWQNLFPAYDWDDYWEPGPWRSFQFSPQRPRQNITANFTCPNFLSYIRTRTNRSAPLPIYSFHVSNIPLISAPNHDITSLSGIQYFSNLENLIVQGNNLTELDLSGLHHLQHLNASNNNLTTLNISDATALTALSISRNNISTITGLDTLANLEVFWAEDNIFASLDFHPAAPLERIDVRGNTPPLLLTNITGATAVVLQDYDPAEIFRPRTWARLRILSGLAL